ncbi:SDR family NAD(P)-dependent oxidoreductase [Paenibacillus sp. MMS18-CY102]|uniref:SDR family NAD(P)-dependent oxidoreductase n=1 Tax=Paenibacillus sp. MMS18-CY102 TaxID=2682849 RepID=UPI001365F362|nr:SDR family NAD(P)-dependent oxidoreductase [Paenibacillus sp. MMS18-CY102]MWC30954.1 SDR family NAD(P)-dependent oxidoreductase [Paenibacillus sp. MMS18-CY102]
MSNHNQQIAVITASYSGLGTELCKLLAQDSYKLVLLNRDKLRTENQLDSLRQAFPGLAAVSVIADLSDHNAIREAAMQVAEQHPRIDKVFHNAGILQNHLAYSPQGNEIHFEVNTVAPVLLTHLLKPQLAASGNAIVTAVGSSAMRMARQLHLGKLQKPIKFKKFSPYAQSKLATAAAFIALSESFAKDNILLRVVDPGPNKTAMSASSGLPGWFKLLRPFFNSPDVGAKRIYEAAHAAAFNGQTGIYIEKGKVAQPPRIALNSKLQNELLLLLQEITNSTA